MSEFMDHPVSTFRIKKSSPQQEPKYIDCGGGSHEPGMGCDDCRTGAIEDAVRPAHYAVGAEHEVYKCLRAWGLESDAFLWTVVKYISRCGKKDGNPILQDLKKASWYLTKRIEQLEGEQK